MRMTLVVGLLALLTFAHPTLGVREAGAAEPQKANINIVRIKSALNLTSAQQRYWHPVEVTLRHIARQQASDGAVKPAGRGRVAIVFDSAALAKLAAAVKPLVRVLDDAQKQTAMSLAYEMGFAWVLARI